MANWDLPKYVELNGINENGEKCIMQYKITKDCDYRVVLDAMKALVDKKLDEQRRIDCALYIFYEDLSGCQDIQGAIDEMTRIMNLGKEVKEDDAPSVMDWEHDFKNIAPPVSRILGYSVRDPNIYTHWYDWIGAYGEIGDCYWARVMSIRNKLRQGKTLDANERDFYKSNKEDIDLPVDLNEDDQKWLNDD